MVMMITLHTYHKRILKFKKKRVENRLELHACCSLQNEGSFLSIDFQIDTIFQMVVIFGLSEQDVRQ